jgi:hypothetical protein
MTTRFDANSQTRFGVQGVPSGYDNVPKDPALFIPPVGIIDVDTSLFNLFEKEIKFTVLTSTNGKEDLKKVPVIFSSSEKWALAKNKKGIRDSNGSLILPLVTIVRKSIEQGVDDITGRGINQQTGEITIRRKLDNSDRSYQNLINRLFIKNQTNVAVNTSSIDGQITTTRAIGDLTLDPDIVDGGLLAPKRNNNVYETLVIPAPQFYKATYDVTFRAQYVSQMNKLVETLISSFLPQGNAWKLTTEKGYWFIATVDSNQYSDESNVEDMSSEERILQYKFTITVQGYILASKVEGAQIPIKRYVSSPSVSFDVSVDETLGSNVVDDPYLGADDPTLPLDTRSNKRFTDSTKLYPHKDVSPLTDPARKALPRGQSVAKYKQVISVDSSGNKTTKNVRITTSNKTSGETTYSQDLDLGSMMKVVDGS